MYRLEEWDISDDGTTTEDLLQNGNRLLTGNGYLGRRGVPDDADASALPATILSGIYDQQGELWREPVNAPDPLYTAFSVDGLPLRLDGSHLLSHEQALNFRYGIYSRKTTWRVGGSPAGALTLRARRFADMSNVHRLCATYALSSDVPVMVTVKTGVNCAVRDLNGPHLGGFRFAASAPLLTAECRTLEQQIPLAVASGISGLDGIKNGGGSGIEKHEIQQSGDGIFHIYTVRLDGKAPVEFEVCGAVYTNRDVTPDRANRTDGGGDLAALAEQAVTGALNAGWEETLVSHQQRWDAIWETGDVVIEGDDYVRRCLRYSLYHLHIIAPRHGRSLSIPARGLSGQTYKGAIFWDTEMFMAPYFLCVEPGLAAQFIRYRVQTLPGAKRKAAEYGYRGAFYAWESQETGDDACTEFNVIDVFTGRPVRTYFRDKQIHISADVVYGIHKYVDHTGDTAILREGALEVILECARFFLSWLYYSPGKKRYEALDVTGPDEYHERVHNNAFTNRMIFAVFETALEYIKGFRKMEPDFLADLLDKLDFEDDLASMEAALPHLYLPQPSQAGIETGIAGIIEQFDGYFRLEDCSIAEVRSRLKDPREYWGGAGVAAATRIIKQADVVAMLVLFGTDFSSAVKKANLDFYEGRTEHGSSLSACMYALLSCETGDSERAYPYFLKTAETDITGKSKQFAGLVYIGGTHPAANGGAWMVAVQGFCGFSVEHGEIKITPRLPKAWRSVSFSTVLGGVMHNIRVTKDGYEITKIPGHDI
ncbi:MAG: glycoside hydrolase family 65 protein [Treponema sp.]|jgi:trehalose/maltose hydrolase-like predicted phosphorylase|nr:glycoside hydrolase family 65 protein [Treponema sp.]